MANIISILKGGWSAYSSASTTLKYLLYGTILLSIIYTATNFGKKDSYQEDIAAWKKTSAVVMQHHQKVKQQTDSLQKLANKLLEGSQKKTEEINQLKASNAVIHKTNQQLEDSLQKAFVAKEDTSCNAVFALAEKYKTDFNRDETIIAKQDSVHLKDLANIDLEKQISQLARHDADSLAKKIAEVPIKPKDTLVGGIPGLRSIPGLKDIPLPSRFVSFLGGALAATATAILVKR